MALPNTLNSVTVRRVSALLSGVWSKVKTALGKKIDEAEQIGGVNLLSSALSSGPNFYNQMAPTLYAGDGEKFTGTSASDSYFFGTVMEAIAANEIVTISFDVSGLRSGEYISFTTVDATIREIHANGRQSYTFPMATSYAAGATINLMDDSAYFYNTAPHGFTISNIKLERGRVATAYTRHPLQQMKGAIANGNAGFPIGGDVYTALNGIDASVVHKAGDETITGVKTFNNTVSPRQTGNGFTKQSKDFTCSIIKPYDEWTSAEQDGNHFRLWTIDITSIITEASTHCNIVVKMMGSYYYTPGNGVLQKEIVAQIHNGEVRVSRSDYTVAQAPCADEFSISDVFKSGSSYFIQVVNRNPTANNYPLRLGISMFNKNASAVLDSVTLAESITEGLPSWAVAVAQVTASGSPVLTEARGNAVTATKPLATLLTSADDLDNVKGDGTGVYWYYWNTGNVPAHARSNATTYMEVVRMHTGNYLFQTIYEASSQHLYRRQCRNGTWDAWYYYAKASTTLSGYGITNAYTKTEVDSLLTGKLGTSGDGSSVTVMPDGTSTGTDIGSSTTLTAWAQKFKNLVGSLKRVAFSGAYSDLSGTPTIPDNTELVHKTGSETITGLKTFNNAMSPRQTGDGFMKQSKVFVGSVIKPYADWEASQKDGNHFRAWTIDLTSAVTAASTHGNIVIKLMGSYYNTPAIGALQKVLTFQVNSGNVIISKGDYIVAQTPCSEEFAISDVFKSGSSYVVQVVNRKPTVNNYPLRLEIEMFNRNASAVFDSVTMTESIISGWPSWAGDVSASVRVTASGSPVLTEISVTTGDNPGQIKVNGQNVSVNGWTNIYVLDSPAASYESNAIYLI